MGEIRESMQSQEKTQKTAGHWPFSMHFSKMADKISSRTHSNIEMANKIHTDMTKFNNQHNILYLQCVLQTN